jgi:predicted RNase H-like HicB family nuclease
MIGDGLEGIVTRFSVVLVPAGGEWVSVLVPAMPGCVSQGRTREDALDNVRSAMEAWLEVEAEQGRAPLVEDQALVLRGLEAALRIMDDMRAAGELPHGGGYHLEVATVEVEQAVAA